MSQRSCLTVILAAGEGKRFLSAVPKVMHCIANRPMLGYVIAAASAAETSRLAVVHGPDMDMLADYVRESAIGDDGRVTLFRQDRRCGTAHAVLAARAALEKSVDDVLILFGDTPLIHVDTLRSARAALADGADVVVFGFRATDPSGYGRLIVDHHGCVVGICEHRDAGADELGIDFCNSGAMALSGREALSLLLSIGNRNSQDEYYLTDVVLLARQRGLRIDIVECAEEDSLGINDRIDLARVEAIVQTRLRSRALSSGVSMIAPETVFLSQDTVLEADVLIEPHVVFGAGVSVARGAVIRSFCHLAGVMVGPGVRVGPFARLRPGVSLDEGVRIGNFVELKDTRVGAGTRINHLSYMGDAHIGAGANIGAGVITCNYDGVRKQRTEIGNGAFIGSNSSLVAPVSVGDGSYIGSGSVITRTVSAGDLALERGEQIAKSGWADRFRDRGGKAKEGGT